MWNKKPLQKNKPRNLITLSMQLVKTKIRKFQEILKMGLNSSLVFASIRNFLISISQK